MPPFAPAECPHCRHRNRYDVAGLKANNSFAYKGTVYRVIEEDEEFTVTCEKCGRSFKLTVRGGKNAKEK